MTTRKNLKEILKIQNRETRKLIFCKGRKLNAFEDFSMLAPAFYDDFIKSLTPDECKIVMNQYLSAEEEKMLIDNVSDNVLQLLLRNNAIKLKDVSKKRLKKYFTQDLGVRSFYFPVIWKRLNFKEKIDVICFIFSESELNEFSRIFIGYEKNQRLLMNFLEELIDEKNEGMEREQVYSAICKNISNKKIVKMFFDSDLINEDVAKMILQTLDNEDRLVAVYQEVFQRHKVDFLCDFNFFVTRKFKNKYNVFEDLSEKELQEFMIEVQNQKANLAELFTVSQLVSYYGTLSSTNSQQYFLKKILDESNTEDLKFFCRMLWRAKKLENN